jgi:hypothetical protein
LWDLELGIWNLGFGTWNLGFGTWDFLEVCYLSFLNVIIPIDHGKYG